jgi:DNA invertase Pin-like site-specific DNA recombinase
VTITPEQAAEWRRRYTDGATLREIAAEAGVSDTTVLGYVGRAVTRRRGPRGRTDVTVQAALDALAEYGSRAKAAKALGVSRTLLATRLRDAGMGADPHGKR